MEDVAKKTMCGHGKDAMRERLLGAIFGEPIPAEERQEVDFGAIAAKLCGQELTPMQEASIAAFDMEHDEAAERKREERERRMLGW